MAKSKGRDTLREIGVGVTSSFDSKGFKEAVKAVDDLKKSLSKSGRTNPFQSLQKNATKFENTLKRIEKSMVRIARTKGSSLEYGTAPSRSKSSGKSEGSKSGGSYSMGRASVEAAITSLAERIKRAGGPLSKKVAEDLEKVLDQVGKGNLKSAKEAFRKYKREWQTNTEFTELTESIGSNLDSLDEVIENLEKSFGAFERQLERFVRHMPTKQVEFREDYKKIRDQTKGNLKEGGYYGAGIVSKVMAHREMKQKYGRSYNPALGAASAAAKGLGGASIVGGLTKAIPVIGTVASAIMTAAAVTRKFRERIGKLNESFFALQASTQGISTSTTVAMVNNIKATDSLNDFARSHRKTRDEVERLSIALGAQGFMFKDIFDTLNSQGRSFALETSINAAHIFGTSLEEAAGIVGQFRHTIGMQLDKMGSAFMRLQHDAQKSGIPIEMFRKDVMDLSMQLVKYNADFENISDAYRKFNSVIKLPIQLARQLGTQFVTSLQQMETGQAKFLIDQASSSGGKGDIIAGLSGTRDRLLEKKEARTADTKDLLTLERLEGIISKLEKGGGVDVMDAKFVAETVGDPNVMIRGLTQTLEGRTVQVGDELVRQFMGIFGLAPELEHAVVASVRNMQEIEKVEAEIAELKKDGAAEESDSVQVLRDKLKELKGDSEKMTSEIAESQYQQMEKAIQEQLKETRSIEQVISDSIYGAIDSLWTRLENPLYTIAKYSSSQVDIEKKIAQAKVDAELLPKSIEAKKKEVEARKKSLSEASSGQVFGKSKAALEKAQSELTALEGKLDSVKTTLRTGGVGPTPPPRPSSPSLFVAPGTMPEGFFPSGKQPSVPQLLTRSENESVIDTVRPMLLGGRSAEEKGKIGAFLENFAPTFIIDAKFDSSERERMAKEVGPELAERIEKAITQILADMAPKVTSGT